MRQAFRSATLSFTIRGGTWDSDCFVETWRRGFSHGHTVGKSDGAIAGGVNDSLSASDN